MKGNDVEKRADKLLKKLVDDGEPLFTDENEQNYKIDCHATSLLESDGYIKKFGEQNCPDGFWFDITSKGMKFHYSGGFDNIKKSKTKKWVWDIIKILIGAVIGYLLGYLNKF